MSKNKLFMLCICLALLLGSAHGLSIDTNGNTLKKGETLEISGTADTGPLTLKVFSGDWLMAEKTITPENGFFSFEHEIGFSEPGGNWRAVVSQGNDLNAAEFTVENSPESAFLLVKILSPSKTSLAATEKVSLSVMVTDSGKPVERAIVFAWFPSMEKIHLTETKNGIYSKELVLPPMLQPGRYKLIFTAEKVFSQEKVFGGENSFEISVARPEIILKILRPALPEAMAGKPIEIAVLPEYSTGIVVEDSEITGNIGNNSLSFEKTSEGFVAHYTPQETDPENLKIEIFAMDSFGNSGKTELTVKITGQTQNFLEQNFPWILGGAALAVIAVIAFFIYCKKVRCGKKNFEKKKEVKMQIKQLENSFYKKANIDRKTFDEEMAKCRQELAELDSKD